MMETDNMVTDNVEEDLFKGKLIRGYIAFGELLYLSYRNVCLSKVRRGRFHGGGSRDEAFAA